MIQRRRILGGMAAVPLFLMPGAAQGVKRDKLRALVIGIDGYSRIRPLERARADAKAVHARIASFGYDVRVTYDPDRATLEAALQQFVQDLNPETAAFLFFAGHGVQIGGDNYLLPTDVPATALRDGGFPLSAVMARIADRAPKQSIFVLDACRDGPALGQSEGARKGFTSVQVPNNFYVAYSAGSGQTALDGLGGTDSDPNGVFTRHFIRHLSPTLPFDAVIKRTRAQVSLTARRVRHDQNPAIYDQTQGDLWLDGVPRRRGDISTAGSEWGLIPAAEALIVSDNGRCGRLRLSNPINDARRLAAGLTALGARARWLHQPSPDQLLAEAIRMGQAEADTKIIYFSGIGGFPDGDGALFLTGNPMKGAGKAAEMGAYPVSLGELHAALTGARATPAGELATRGTARRPPRTKPVRILYLMDTGLTVDTGLLTKKTYFLQNFVASRQRSGLQSEVGILYATSLFGQAMDGDHNGSPFNLALLNTLARPGLTMLEIANLVRVEVEDMTEGNQSPAFFSTLGLRDHVLVEPIESRVAAEVAPEPVASLSSTCHADR